MTELTSTVAIAPVIATPLVPSISKTFPTVKDDIPAAMPVKSTVNFTVAGRSASEKTPTPFESPSARPIPPASDETLPNFKIVVSTATSTASALVPVGILLTVITAFDGVAVCALAASLAHTGVLLLSHLGSSELVKHTGVKLLSEHFGFPLEHSTLGGPPDELEETHAAVSQL